MLGSRAPPLVGRFVPFMAVAVANMVNIPCMRQQELKGKRKQYPPSNLVIVYNVHPLLPLIILNILEGVVVYDEDGNKLGNSPVAARTAITKVTISRICIAAPGMCKFSLRKYDVGGNML